MDWSSLLHISTSKIPLGLAGFFRQDMFLLSQDYWEIRKTSKKGRGIFAKKDIPAGTVIGDYIGKVLRPDEEDEYEKKGLFYLMYYHDTASIFPDVKKPGIHLLNHACTPNTWMYTYRGHCLYFALRHIFAGEELTVDYLVSPLDEDCKPCTHFCHCSSVICSNTMHLTEKRYDEWNEFLEKEEARTKRQRIRYGKTLPLLKDYPTMLPDADIYTLFGSHEKDPREYDDATLPSKQELRKRIRETGQTLLFPKLNIHVFGFLDHKMISETIDH